MRSRHIFRCGPLVAVLALLIHPGCEETAPSDPIAPPPTREPLLTGDLLPPGLERWTIGESTEADVLRTYSTAVRRADKSLRGKVELQRNGRPAVTLSMTTRQRVRREVNAQELPERRAFHRVARTPNVLNHERYFSKLTTWFVPDDQGINRLVAVDLIRPIADDRSLCAWLDASVGNHPEAQRCPGTEAALGVIGSTHRYCAADGRGLHNVLVTCEPIDDLGVAAEQLTIETDLKPATP